MAKCLGTSARFGLLMLGMVLVVAFDAPLALADPPTFWVNNSTNGPWVPPGTSCDQPGFQHIQDAVNAAPSGSRINVCPGTYPEQVVVATSAKDNITLVSVRLWQAIIQAPPVLTPPYRAIVQVSSAQNVGIIAFTITGPLTGGCDNNGYGIRVDGAGSANIYGNHITKIEDTPSSLFGCQDGVAIQVGRAFQSTTGSANIFGNVIDNYQKNGPTVSGAGSTARIVANRVTGIGPTNLIAQNGMQISSGATATISHNFVANNMYSPQTVASTGLLLFNSGVVAQDHNTFAANDVDDYMFGAAAGSQTTYSHVRTSTFDGVVVDAGTSNAISNNAITQNGGPGVGMYDAASANKVSSNEIDHNAINCSGDPAQCSEAGGILLENVQSNTIASNHVRNNGTANALNPTDGIRVNSGSTQNLIQSNFASGNVTYDCHDMSTGGGTSGTANSWLNDIGQTANPRGICRPSTADEDEQDSQTSMQIATAAGWDPAYAWYTGDAIASQYDWSSVYSTVPVQSFLSLPAAPALSVRHAPAPTP